MANKSRIQTLFSDAASTYDAYAVVQRQTFGHVASLVTGQPTSILDIGCGTGTHTVQLATRFPSAKVIGLDIAPGMIQMAQAQPKLDNLVWVVGDAESGLPGTGYDLIVANAALHWFDELPRALPHILNSMASNGQLVFTLFGATTYQELRAMVARVLGQPIPLASDLFSTPEMVARVMAPLVQTVAITQQLIRVRYQSLMDVLRAIKKTGTRGPIETRRVWTPQLVHAVESAYRAVYGQIWVTHQVFYVDCRHPQS